MMVLVSLGRCERALHLRAPEDVHHLLGRVGAGGVPLPAQDLALGGEAELGGQVVLGLGGSGVDLVLLGLAVAETGERQTSDKIPTCHFGTPLIPTSFLHSTTAMSTCSRF